jgi:hypothetical protein
MLAFRISAPCADVVPSRRFFGGKCGTLIEEQVDGIIEKGGTRQMSENK